jgi:hypothetical protein
MSVQCGTGASRPGSDEVTKAAFVGDVRITSWR